jgi:hypothetical protein
LKKRPQQKLWPQLMIRRKPKDGSGSDSRWVGVRK